MLLLGLAPLGWLLVRRRPEAIRRSPDGERPVNQRVEEAGDGHTLRQALLTPAFWVFGLASSVYGLTASGIALFNESILAERGFDASTYHRTLVIGALTALVGNFLGGWLASKWAMNRLLALAMVLLAASLSALPHVRTQAHVTAYALVMGLAGGFVIVIFFTFWSRAYGRAHLGKIQGAAQALTVLASAVETAEVFGLDWGGGLYVNYALLLAWVLDVLLWWRHGLDAYRRRPWPLVAAWHGLLIFIFFNATVVFKTGIMRWTGLCMCLGLCLVWWRATSNNSPRSSGNYPLTVAED
jgi:MFS family permease